MFQNKLFCRGFYRWASSALESNIRNVHGSETSPSCPPVFLRMQKLSDPLSW